MKAKNQKQSEAIDHDRCRAQRANGPGMVFCLHPDGRQCEHVGFFDHLMLCLHPDREAIIARTHAGVFGNQPAAVKNPVTNA